MRQVTLAKHPKDSYAGGEAEMSPLWKTVADAKLLQIHMFMLMPLKLIHSLIPLTTLVWVILLCTEVYQQKSREAPDSDYSLPECSQAL